MKNPSEAPLAEVFSKQVGGSHYKKLGIYQPWIVSSKWMTPEELKGAIKHTVFSYLAREADKGGIEDIKKAYHTLGIYLELVKNSEAAPCEGNAECCRSVVSGLSRRACDADHFGEENVDKIIHNDAMGKAPTQEEISFVLSFLRENH